MAVTLTAEQRATLRSGAVVIRTLVDFHLGSGRYSFWDGEAHRDFGGQIYLAAGALASISPMAFGSDLGAEGIEIVLDGTRLVEGAALPGDPAALLATIHDEAYHQKRVDVRFGFFNAETYAHVLTLKRFAGIIDQIEIRDEVGDGGAGRVLMVIKCESVARRYGRREGRTRSHEDQNEIWSGDDFFKHTSASVAKERLLLWGRRPPAGRYDPGVSGSGGGTAAGPDQPLAVDPRG